MIHINSPEDFQKWILEGYKRSKLYSGWVPTNNSKELKVESLGVTQKEGANLKTPPKASEEIDNGLDSIEPEVIDTEIG